MPKTNPVKKHQAENTQSFINHQITQPLAHHHGAPIGPWRLRDERVLEPVFMGHLPVLLSGHHCQGLRLIQDSSHQMNWTKLVSVE